MKSEDVKNWAVGLAAVVSSIALPAVGLIFSRDQSRADFGLRNLDLATRVLTSTVDRPQSEEIRAWAVGVVRQYSTVPLSPQAGTQLAELPVRTVEVRIPVAVPCVRSIPERPQYPDTPDAVRRASDIEARVRLILAGRLLREAHEAELRALLSACSTRPMNSDAAN